MMYQDQHKRNHNGHDEYHPKHQKLGTAANFLNLDNGDWKSDSSMKDLPLMRSNLMSVLPPLRSSSTLWSAPVVGIQPDLIASEKVIKFADILYWIKLHPFPDRDFQKTTLNALKKENAEWKINLVPTDTGTFDIYLYVENVLVSRGSGVTPNTAEQDGFKDFVERVMTSDYLVVESDEHYGMESDVPDSNKKTELKLYETEIEVKEAHITAFRYDLLCKDHMIPETQIPACSDCHRTGHNRYFCTDTDQNRYVPSFSKFPKNSEAHVDARELEHGSENVQDPIKQFIEEEDASFRGIATYFEKISDGNEMQNVLLKYADSCPAEQKLSYFSKVLKYLSYPLEAYKVFVLFITEDQKEAFYDHQVEEVRNQCSSSLKSLSLRKSLEAYEDYLKHVCTNCKLQHDHDCPSIMTAVRNQEDPESLDDVQTRAPRIPEKTPAHRIPEKTPTHRILQKTHERPEKTYPIFVRGLADNVSLLDLKKIFSGYKYKSIYKKSHKGPTTIRCFSFSQAEAMFKEMQGFKLKGQPLLLVFNFDPPGIHFRNSKKASPRRIPEKTSPHRIPEKASPHRIEKKASPHRIPEKASPHTVLDDTQTPLSYLKIRSRIVSTQGGTNDVKKALHFLQTFPDKTGKPGEIMRMFNSQQDRLSSEEVNAVAMYIMHKEWINESYLFTLYALKHYHLDARVMVDYLAHERQNLEHLKQYLDNISANRVDPVLEFLASLATCSHSYGMDLLDKLRKLEFLPNNYLEGKNVAHLFSAERILKMMEEVCAHKGLHLPLGMKKLKLKNLFRFLMSAFEAHQVEIADFIKIVDIAAERLKIGHEVTVEFFQSRIPALASYYSKECGLQDPETPPNSILKFEPRQCMEPNQKLHDINKGLTKVMVSSVDDIKTFRRSLSNKFKSIALASHQPSDLIPGVSGCDMISVRTLDGIFHLRKTGKEDELVKKFVDELRDVIHTKTFFVGDGVIKYLAKELNLQITKFVDVTFGRNGKSVSVNDMAQRIVKEDYCERASFFSAHALPSVEAQRHWELQLSLTFECGQLKLDAQGEGAYSHT